MKDKSEVKTDNGKTVFYAVMYDSFRKAALECGYALALHGSMQRDMDLIAVAWTEDAKPVLELVTAISDCIGNTIWKGHHFKNPEIKPHGKICYTLSIFSDWFIDLTIIPPHFPKLHITELAKDAEICQKIAELLGVPEPVIVVEPLQYADKGVLIRLADGMYFKIFADGAIWQEYEGPIPNALAIADLINQKYYTI